MSNTCEEIVSKTTETKSIKILSSGKIKKYVHTGLKVFQNATTTNQKDMKSISSVIVVIFTAKGSAINKAITVVEIIKREMNGLLHQYTQIGRNFPNEKKSEELKKKDIATEVMVDNNADIVVEKEKEEQNGEKSVRMGECDNDDKIVSRFSTSKKKLPAPTITIYLSTKAIPKLEESFG
nr:8543_t:CDS:2 [Entrophospora candida]